MPNDMSELGAVGLKLSAGQVSEEFLAKLRGARGLKVYREMGDNDPIVGGILFAFEKMVQRLDWHIEPAEEPTPQEEEEADYIQSCLDDMSDSWDSTLSGILSMAPFGWSFHEICYKQRQGESDDPTKNSKFTDGKIGWRKWAIRAQESLVGWDADDNGGIQGFKQKTEGHEEVLIPMQKGLLFRTTTAKGNPEGRSLLRNAYRPWFFKKRIEEIEAVGIERDLAGLPVAWVAPEYLSPNATMDQKALLETVTSLVQNIKRNETEGIVFPLDYNEAGHKTIDLTLMSTGGSRQFDTDKIVSRYNQQIAMSVLADFLLLGHEGVGSQSLGSSKIDLWMMSVEALAKAIAEVVNQHAIPRLMKLNGIKTERLPRLVFGSVEQKDITAISGYIKSLVDGGIITPDPTLEAHVRELASLPPIDEAYMQEQMDAASEAAANLPPQPPVPGEEQDAEEDAEEDEDAEELVDA